MLYLKCFLKISNFLIVLIINNYKYIILILLHLSNKKQYICNVLFWKIKKSDFYNRCILKIINKYTNLFRLELEIFSDYLY